ncbi:hypothetical protein [Nocardia sp. NPDC051570]|uniref:hypothetical protein n=1 Tax=Nocardia sp. NPDC051570 TaxID=3364324 RepID=UPI00379D43BE
MTLRRSQIRRLHRLWAIICVVADYAGRWLGGVGLGHAYLDPSMFVQKTGPDEVIFLGHSRLDGRLTADERRTWHALEKALSDG